MRINLRPRLMAVLEMLGVAGGSGIIADVGCDHGRLCAALIESETAKRVIASDISEPSLAKARVLCKKCGILQNVDLCVSDGLAHLAEKEFDSIAIAGMGGELIADILRAGEAAARRARRIVMQPMRGVSELRQYLYNNTYRIVDERVVYDAKRYYQIIAAVSGEPAPWPDGFPREMFEFGTIMAERGDAEFMAMLDQYRAGHMRRLKRATADGVAPEPLICELNEITAVIKYTMEHRKNENQ